MPSWIIPALVLLTLAALGCLGIYVCVLANTWIQDANEPPVGGRHD